MRASASLAAPVGKGDALGPMLLHDGFQPPGHLVQGFVPADTAPLAFAAPALAVEPVSGETHLRHHISPNGYYRGKKVVKTKADE